MRTWAWVVRWEEQRNHSWAVGLQCLYTRKQKRQMRNETSGARRYKQNRLTSTLWPLPLMRYLEYGWLRKKWSPNFTNYLDSRSRGRLSEMMRIKISREAITNQDKFQQLTRSRRPDAFCTLEVVMNVADSVVPWACNCWFIPRMNKEFCDFGGWKDSNKELNLMFF